MHGQNRDAIIKSEENVSLDENLPYDPCAPFLHLHMSCSIKLDLRANLGTAALLPALASFFIAVLKLAQVFFVLPRVLALAGAVTGGWYPLMLNGMNLPTCRWYSLYSGYFPDEIHSVRIVEEANIQTRLMTPAEAQVKVVLVEMALQMYSESQIVCSAAKFGCLLYFQSPDVRKPRLRSSTFQPCGTIAVFW